MNSELCRLRAQGAEGAGGIREHRGMAVTMTAETVAQDEGPDTVAGEPFSEAGAFVVGKSFVAATGKNEESRGLRGGRRRRESRESGQIVRRSAASQGRLTVPNGKRRRRRRG